AHYCLGIILQYRKSGDAVSHFEAVTRTDPSDPAAWFRLGQMLSPDEDEERRFRCFEKALELNPYLTGALDNLQKMLRARGDDEKADRLLERMKALERTEVWFDRARIVYSEMGRYAEVIGGPEVAPALTPGRMPRFRRHDKLHVRLAPGA